ncbi:MAG: VOC family protein [Oscillospiraceae bacterium]
MGWCIMISGLGHVAVVVKNLAASLSFYTETLELKEAFRIDQQDGSPFIVYLYIAPGQFIELFAMGNETIERKPTTVGLYHICLTVKNVEQAYQSMLQKNAPIDSAISEGRAKCKQFWTHDPDGNAIEIMELPPESLHVQAPKRFAEIELNNM